jgi:putative FmdB family regulatory protein
MEVSHRGLPHLPVDWSKVMPTYEYSCNECGTYGSVQKSYDDDIAGMECPKCNLQMSRIYSAPGLIFKGGGWGGKP